MTTHAESARPRRIGFWRWIWLALAGLEAQIQTATLPDKTVWHRVRLGPYSSAADLDKARAALKENKIDNAVIKVNEPLAKR